MTNNSSNDQHGAAESGRSASPDAPPPEERVPFADMGGLPIAPETNGCYGWPRACEHVDDVACMQAENDGRRATRQE